MRNTMPKTVALLAGSALLAAGTAHADRSEWPTNFTVGTASQGGTYFVYGSGWANFIAEELDVSGGGEVTGSITLKVQQAGQVGMVQLHWHRRTKKRFALQRDAKAGRLQHGKVVGAVADTHRIFTVNAEIGAVLVKKHTF